jgi:opacity protein-like surface antigen
MQRILLSLCTGTLLLFVQPKAQAQEQPSSFKKNLIGGSIGFGYAKNTDPVTLLDRTNTNISFAPIYAYYLKPNFAIGASLGYTYNKNEHNDGFAEQKYNYYTFRPFIRFEIPLWQSKFSIYNDLGLSGTYIKVSQSVDSTSSNYDLWSAGAFWEPGIMFRIKSNIALQASLGSLVSYDYEKRDGGYTHSFGIRTNRNGTDEFKIGINFLF